MKTVFIPITEEMLILHPIRTMHKDFNHDSKEIENYIDRICQYIWVNGELTNKFWKVKGYTINKIDDGVIVLVSYRQAVATENFPTPQRNLPFFNTSPLPES